VTLPPDRPDRLAALQDLPVLPLTVPDAASGMSASLREGVAAARRLVTETLAGLMILPADMPEFTTPALDAIIAAFRAQPDLIWRGATAGGQPGHPAVFPRDLWPDLARIAGDQGGLSVIRAHAGRTALLPLPGEMAIIDLDTPEDWAAWHGSGGE
jgi:CTP:molybdopterin cytidylyltransferase MocA